MGLSPFQGAGVRRLAAVALVVALVPAELATAQETYLLVVVGLGGEPEYTEQFHRWATTLIEAATTRYEVPRDRITYLGERRDLDLEAIDERSSRENVEAAVGAIAERASPGDHIAIVLFGHGSFTDIARINLPGRDLSADDFADLLNRFDVERLTFVNTTSASGPFIKKLSKEGRIVVTATRTGGERNASIFGGFFVEAFASGETDADQSKDGRVSVLEAFTYARLRVAQTYEADGRLATEHPLLDDNGDGEGAGEPDPLTGDGMVARRLFLTAGTPLRADIGLPDDPELRVLYDERQELEIRIDELQRIRGGIDPAQYEQALEDLLVQLALKSREIRQLEEASGVPEPR